MGQAWMEFVFPWIDIQVPLYLQTSEHLPQRLKFVLRNTCTLRPDELFCMERTRWASPNARPYIPRSMLHELCANVPNKAAAVRPWQLPGKIAKRADCWLRSTAQVHWTPSVPV
jgi:hypothetical protein